MKHYFNRTGMLLSEYLIVSPNNVHPIKQSCQKNGFSRASDD